MLGICTCTVPEKGMVMNRKVVYWFMPNCVKRISVSELAYKVKQLSFRFHFVFSPNVGCGVVTVNKFWTDCIADIRYIVQFHLSFLVFNYCRNFCLFFM